MQWHRRLRWDPGRLTWRVAVLFMAGSFLFALGSFPLYAQKIDPGTVGITFVAGSVFFTAAAVGQLLDTRRAGPSVDPLLLWAALVQLAGTILFNVNTIDALFRSLDTEQTNRLVWAPDMFGSAAFLIASHLAWLVVCHRKWWCVRGDDATWWVAALNYVGSIFFMASAIASFTLATTGNARNTTVVNAGTFLGALCFLAGSYLLLPARDSAPLGAPTS